MSLTMKVNKTVFIHNGDLSGDVEIRNENGSLKVNGDDIVGFVLEYIRDEKIKKLESLDYDELKSMILSQI